MNPSNEPWGKADVVAVRRKEEGRGEHKEGTRRRGEDRRRRGRKKEKRRGEEGGESKVRQAVSKEDDCRSAGAPQPATKSRGSARN